MTRTGRQIAVLAALAVASLLVALALAPRSEARAPALTKTEARSTAEEEALDLFLYHTWASDFEISSCNRSSRAKARCTGKISGVELEDCSEVTFECTYTGRECTFDVVVKRVGIDGALSRSQNVHCTEFHFSD